LKRYMIDIEFKERDDALPMLELKTINVDRIDATIGTIQLRSLYPTQGKCQIDLQQELGESDIDSIRIEIRGYSVNRLVARHRKQFTLSVA